MIGKLWILLLILFIGTADGDLVPDEPRNSMTIVFATFAETEVGMRYTVQMAESLREYGGRYADTELWLYVPAESPAMTTPIRNSLETAGIEVFTCTSPEEALWLPYHGKVFAAGMAERLAVSRGAKVLVWMDPDTIFLNEPIDLDLPDSVLLAYRPVMHNRSGTLYGQPPNEYWANIYRVLSISDDMLFPMVTPCDRQTINVYFNSGLVAVRPELGVLQAWGDDFRRLYSDSVLTSLCRDNQVHAIFLHQTALVGSVLHRIGRSQVVELPETYNYPIFFHQQWESAAEFDDIRGVVTMRHEGYFRNPDPAWAAKLKARKGVVDWLKDHLGG